MLLFVFVEKQVLIKFTQPERENRKKGSSSLQFFLIISSSLQLVDAWPVFYMSVSTFLGKCPYKKKKLDKEFKALSISLIDGLFIYFLSGLIDSLGLINI